MNNLEKRLEALEARVKAALGQSQKRELAPDDRRITIEAHLAKFRRLGWVLSPTAAAMVARLPSVAAAVQRLDLEGFGINADDIAAMSEGQWDTVSDGALWALTTARGV